jgi:hypothetical protein
MAMVLALARRWPDAAALYWSEQEADLRAARRAGSPREIKT